ncbi:hypothetical protein SDC9_25939 [bioreactor metagenome]|uniref:Uncharacterized protein n=1 Tax=bioreactor metagenome TaxID=1076179 RepID=A0A644ULX4_9ZZZZ|nr:hypothetical protein [Macellibacteroides fermentans]
MTLSELDENIREQLEEALMETISDFLSYKNYLPEKKHKRNILDSIIKETTDVFNFRLTDDENLGNLFDGILKEITEEMKADGLILPTHNHNRNELIGK